MRGIPVFDNVNFTDSNGNLTDPIRNNFTQLYQALQYQGASNITTKISPNTPLAPDNNFIARGLSIVPYDLPLFSQLGSFITITNPESGPGFVINIGIAKTIQWLATIGSTSLTMTDAGSAITLYCVTPDKDFLVINHEGTILLV